MFNDLKESLIISIERLLLEMQAPNYRAGAAAVGTTAERLAAEAIVAMFMQRLDNRRA